MQLQEAISTLRQGIDTILNCDVPYEQMDTALKLVEENAQLTQLAISQNFKNWVQQSASLSIQIEAVKDFVKYVEIQQPTEQRQK